MKEIHVRSQDGSSDIFTDDNVEMVITGIHATKVALGLRRIPAGFYTVVHHSGLEWRTECKNSSVNHDVVGWLDQITLPSDVFSTIRLAIHASFEFQPILGAGEHLRELTVTVGQLLDHSIRGAPFIFTPKDGDLISPCSSILVIIKRRQCGSDLLLSNMPPHRSSESLGDLEETTNQGHSALSRYRGWGEKKELEYSISQFEQALAICPQDHPCRAAAQSNLAMVRFIYHQVEDMDASLDVPLGLYRSALRARPIGHLDRPLTLIQLASVHLVQFGKSKDAAEGVQAKALLDEAIQLSPAESHGKQAAMIMLQLHAVHLMDPAHKDEQSLVEQDLKLRSTDQELRSSCLHLLESFGRSGDLNDLQGAIVILRGLLGSTPVQDDRYCGVLCNLGVALLHRFNSLGDLCDLEEAISTLKDAVELTPCGHLHKPTLLNNLGAAFQTRFDRLGDLRDLEDAISTLRDVIQLTPDDHPHKPALLKNLGSSFRTRFERIGELRDLEDAILSLQDAVGLTPYGHPDRHTCLNSLGLSFQTRFERLGELRDLDNAISMFRNSIECTSHGHPDRAGHLGNLSACFKIRFEHLGELRDLEDAILTSSDTIKLTPDGHPHKFAFLNRLGTCCVMRFKYFGGLQDLEDAISILRDAVKLASYNPSDKSHCLNNLGISLFARFELLGELRDLEDATSMLRDAVALAPSDHFCQPIILSNLGAFLLDRFEHLGEVHDLEDAVSTLKHAAEATSSCHSHKPGILNNLGTSFTLRFKRLGALRDLEDAIMTLRNVVELASHNHLDKARGLGNLGTSLSARFEWLGEQCDLEGAISALREAVELIPDGHPHKPGCLSNLGSSLFARFMRFREFRDLEDAISTLRSVVPPEGYPDNHACLNSLGLCLKTRFEHLGDLCDLEDAILNLDNAVELTPPGHPHKPGQLNNLGVCFRLRFERVGELRDIQDSISKHRGAIEHVSVSHPSKPAYLGNLGVSLLTRFFRLGELCDLEDAILTLLNAIELTPHDHPHRAGHLNNTGTSFIARFQRLGELHDLDDAISMLSDAVQLTPHHHPDKLCRVKNLGVAFQARFQCAEQLRDLEDAIAAYSYAASAPFGPIDLRFRACQDWIACARRMHHHSLLHAYSFIIGLLPQLAWIGLSLDYRHSVLMRAVDVVREAAAAALDAGLPETAVEWLERGRSIIWGELLQLRSSYEELASSYPAHARRLQELSNALDNAIATRTTSFSALRDGVECAADRTPATLRHEVDQHRELAFERDRLVREIQRLPGFEGFPRNQSFSQLRTAAHTGPVVMLNAAESRCDALIILANVDHVIHVPLLNFTLKRCADLEDTLKNIVRHARDGKSVKWEGANWETFLSPLWKSAVKPVLDAIAFSVPGNSSRIFWCPAGSFSFLPIHAAGLYDDQYSQPGYKVFDFVVSSYTPSLAILALPRNPTTVQGGGLRFLAVRQPPTDGERKLAGVATELAYIRKAIQSTASACAVTTLVEPSIGSVDQVLDLMKEADWVHFACHGVQDGIDSGLCLADKRRLKVRDILALSRPRGGLAFLSACQTATGDKRLSDEAIHIAAGMLHAGYGGIIGTMWSVSDTLAPDVARDVYQYLFRKGTRPDHLEAAHALHEAIWELRHVGASFEEWIPFIHVGL